MLQDPQQKRIKEVKRQRTRGGGGEGVVAGMGEGAEKRMYGGEQGKRENRIERIMRKSGDIEDRDER